MLISIDLSLRSTAVVCLDEDDNLVDFITIHSLSKAPKKAQPKFPVLNDEELLIYNSKEIIKFIDKIMETNILRAIVIEGLSFGGLSGAKDIIQGNFWNVRVSVRKRFRNVPIGIIPVTMWRKHAVGKINRKEALEKYGKPYLKEIVVDALPEDIKCRFLKYIKENKLVKTTIYDLSDAYFLGIFRNTL